MNKKTIFIIGSILIAVLVILGVVFFNPPKVMGAPYAVYVRSLLPERSNLYDLGTSSKIWNTILVNTITGSSTIMAGNILADTFNASSTVASSTFGNGLNIIRGCFSINGTCVTGGGASTTLLADNNTFSGNNAFSATILAGDNIDINNGNGIYFDADGSKLTYIGRQTNRLEFLANNYLMTLTDTGNLGVGTTSPYTKLSVVGEVVASHYSATTTATSTYIGGIQMANGAIQNLLTVTRICFSTGECMSSPNVFGSAITLFLWNQAMTDIVGYESLYTIPPIGTEIDESCSADADVDGGYCNLDSYVSTTTDISINAIPSGTWEFEGFNYVDSTAGNSKMETTVYKRDILGTETFLFQATSSDINTTSVIIQNYTSVQSAFSILPTDRIVFKKKAWTDQTSPKVIHQVYGSNNRYSRAKTPISTQNRAFAATAINETITGLWKFTNIGTTTFSGGIETPMLGASIIVATSTTKGSYLTYASSTGFTATNLFATTIFQAPSSATLSFTNTGQIGVDTTSNQFRIATTSGATSAGVVIPPFFYSSFSYATSTTWNGTTTLSLGIASIAETWYSIQCKTDTSFVAVIPTDGTNDMNYSVASGTVGTINLNTNASFTAGEERLIKIGTTTTSSTARIGCTIKKAYTAD